MANARRIMTWRRAFFCEKSDERLPIGLRLFQHWQVCRIIHPLDTNDSWYVLGQPIGDRRAEVSVVLTPQDENGPVEPLHPVQRAHRFQIVLTIKLPMKKSPQARITLRSAQLRGGERREHCVCQAVGRVHGRRMGLALNWFQSESEA